MKVDTETRVTCAYSKGKNSECRVDLSISLVSVLDAPTQNMSAISSLLTEDVDLGVKLCTVRREGTAEICRVYEGFSLIYEFLINLWKLLSFYWLP